MGNMVCYERFDIGHDLCIAGSSCRGHFGHGGFVGFMEVCRLGEEDKGNGEESFDPFDELITTVSLGRVYQCLFARTSPGRR